MVAITVRVEAAVADKWDERKKAKGMSGPALLAHLLGLRKTKRAPRRTNTSVSHGGTPLAPRTVGPLKFMNQYTGKKTSEIVTEIANQDTGFCNPMKIKMANEDFADAREELIDRGYSPCEAERMLRDGE